MEGGVGADGLFPTGVGLKARWTIEEGYSSLGPREGERSKPLDETRGLGMRLGDDLDVGVCGRAG